MIPTGCEECVECIKKGVLQIKTLVNAILDTFEKEDEKSQSVASFLSIQIIDALNQKYREKGKEIQEILNIILYANEEKLH